MRPQIWISPRAQSCSAPSAPPGSAAPARGGCWCSARSCLNCSAGWYMPTGRGGAGGPRAPPPRVGPGVDLNAVRAFERAIESAQAAGGQLLVGGKVLPGPGHFVEPAIVLARNDWDIVQHETFAPILYLIAVDSIDEAIRMQNESAYGLSSGLFTQRLQHAEQYLSHQGSDCGIANVNIGTSGAEIGGAFGGEKETGGGREAGSDAWKAYMRRQTNTVNWSSALPLAQGIEFDIAP